MSMRTLTMALVLLASCARTEEPVTGQQPAASARTTMSCPMAMEGTTVVVDDTSDGVALTFVAAPGQVDAVREHVREMAAMHGTRAAHRPGQGRHAMPDADARYEPTDQGARLVFTPRDEADLDDLRAHVRAQAERMRDGQCPMMHAPADT